MTTLDQLRLGLNRAWETVTEGWHELRDRAMGAITRFQGQEEEKTGVPTARWGVLAAEVTEDDQHITVELETPGLNKEDFDIDVVEQVLVIRGEKHYERSDQIGHYHVMERAFGHFERAIPLPKPVDPGGAQARYQNGVLQVTLPKAPQARATRIQVEPEA